MNDHIEATIKRFRDKYMTSTDEGVYISVWGKGEEDIDMESFLKEALTEMYEAGQKSERTSHQVLRGRIHDYITRIESQHMDNLDTVFILKQLLK